MIYVVAIIAAAVVLLAVLLFLCGRYIRKLSIKISIFRFVWDYLLLEPITFLFRWIPGGWGIIIRYPFYRIVLKKMGWNVTVLEGVKIMFPERFEIGRNCSINPCCFIDAKGGVKIGDWVRIGAKTAITTVIHNADKLDRPIKKQGLTLRPVRIEDDVVIGIGALILPGVTVGKGSYIGAGAVVGTDIPPNSVAVGNPARIVKKRQ